MAFAIGKSVRVIDFSGIFVSVINKLCYDNHNSFVMIETTV